MECCLCDKGYEIGGFDNWEWGGRKGYDAAASYRMGGGIYGRKDLYHMSDDTFRT